MISIYNITFEIASSASGFNMSVVSLSVGILASHDSPRRAAVEERLNAWKGAGQCLEGAAQRLGRFPTLTCLHVASRGRLFSDKPARCSDLESLLKDCSSITAALRNEAAACRRRLSMTEPF